MTEDKEQRRIFLNWKVLGQAERYFILFQFILLALTLVYLLYLIFSTINGVLNEVSQGQGPIVLASAFDQISYRLLIRISILFVFVFLANLVLGFFFLHRLTGPLVRIRKVLDQVADGKIPSREVLLRKGDFPTDLAKSLGRALSRLRTR